MSTTKTAHPFRVIEGGASRETPTVPRGSKAEMQQERLRQAILRLPVPEVGLSVEETLQELSDKLDSEQDADFARLVILRHRVEDLGLRFHLALPHMNLVREGYFALAWPERLVRRHPELAGLDPEAHSLMSVG